MMHRSTQENLLPNDFMSDERDYHDIAGEAWEQCILLEDVYLALNRLTYRGSLWKETGWEPIDFPAGVAPASAAMGAATPRGKKGNIKGKDPLKHAVAT